MNEIKFSLEKEKELTESNSTDQAQDPVLLLPGNSWKYIVKKTTGRVSFERRHYNTFMQCE